MYVFRELTDFSYPAIAREFGGRDHTTVIHAVEKIAGLMKERRQIYEQVTELIMQVRTRASEMCHVKQHRCSSVENIALGVVHGFAAVCG